VTRLLGPGARLPVPPSLFVLDVDGTLLTSAHEVTRATAAEIRRIRRAGVEIVLAFSPGPRAMCPIGTALGLTDRTVMVTRRPAHPGTRPRSR
jgi:hydroxymethylpyrimidine pyrophosphatase-like HAD family hydrolase